MDLGPRLIALVVVGIWLFNDRSNSRLNYFILLFYVYSIRLSLEIVLLTLDIIVVIYWLFKFSRHLLFSIPYVFTLELWATFVDRGCIGVCCYLLIVQITVSAILLTSSLFALNVVVVYWSFRFSLQILYQLLLCITYTLLDHVARFVSRVCRGSFWTFRLSIQLLHSLLLCILSSLKLGGRFVGLGCCGSLLIGKLFDYLSLIVQILAPAILLVPFMYTLYVGVCS